MKFSLADNQICQEPRLLSNFEIGANIDTSGKSGGKSKSSPCIFKNLKNDKDDILNLWREDKLFD